MIPVVEVEILGMSLCGDVVIVTGELLSNGDLCTVVVIPVIK